MDKANSGTDLGIAKTVGGRFLILKAKSYADMVTLILKFHYPLDMLAVYFERSSVTLACAMTSPACVRSTAFGFGHPQPS